MIEEMLKCTKIEECCNRYIPAFVRGDAGSVAKALILKGISYDLVGTRLDYGDIMRSFDELAGKPAGTTRRMIERSMTSCCPKMDTEDFLAWLEDGICEAWICGEWEEGDGLAD